MIQIKHNKEEITQELISPFWKKKNERQHWIEHCSKLTGRPFVFWAVQFKGLPMDFIRDLYLKSQETDSDRNKYFWKLWGESKPK